MRPSRAPVVLLAAAALVGAATPALQQQTVVVEVTIDGEPTRFTARPANDESRADVRDVPLASLATPATRLTERFPDTSALRFEAVERNGEVEVTVGAVVTGGDGERTEPLVTTTIQPGAYRRFTELSAATGLERPTIRAFRANQRFRAAEDAVDLVRPVQLFYGTDRARNPDASRPASTYTSERGTELITGIAEVSIPIDHRVGMIEAPPWWRFWAEPNAQDHVVLLDAGSPLSDAAFLARMRAVIRDGADSALVFVHGYNTTFEQAAQRAAQLAYDLHLPIVPAFYSWASAGTFAGYGADEDAVARAVPYLAEFLELIARERQVERIRVVAHSMGNRAVTEVLTRDLSESLAGKIDHIVLAAPDINEEVFRTQIASRFQERRMPVTLYVSRRDKALLAAQQWRGGWPRIGAVARGMPGVATIDASNIDSSFLNHSYFGDHTSLVSDLHSLFRGLAPDSRICLEPRQDPESNVRYWEFDEDACPCLAAVCPTEE